MTIKCVADQMEADRLERERGYARRREENERAAKAKPAGSGTTTISTTPKDEQLREQCRSGVYYGTNSRVNRDDPEALRKEYGQ